MPSPRARRSSDRLPEPDEGRKPPKWNGTGGRPLPTSAVVTALGPGRTVYSTFSLIHSLTRRNPGSLTEGVPASVTRQSFSPLARRDINSGSRLSSLCSWKLMRGLRISRWARSWAVRRVSSAMTPSQQRNASIALNVRSPRLPIGVATSVRGDLTDSFPDSEFSGFKF